MRKFLKKYQGLIKLLFVFLFAFYLYWRVDWLMLAQMWKSHFLADRFYRHRYALLLCVLVLVIHTSIDAIKWKLLLSRDKKISFFIALKGILMGIPVGLLTPNRVGEHGGRLLAVPAEDNAAALSASVWASLAQWLACIFLGLCLVYLLPVELFSGMNTLVFIVLFLAILLILAAAIYTEKIQWLIPRRWRKNEWFQALYKKRGFPAFMRVVILSLSRYLLFSFQFFLLLYILGVVEMSLWNYILSIAVLVMQSFIPIPGLLSVAAKAEISIFLFGNSYETEIVIAAFLLWIFNLCIPSIIGLILIMRNNLNKSLFNESNNNP